jgi:hypothetical protein
MVSTNQSLPSRAKMMRSLANTSGCYHLETSE